MISPLRTCFLLGVLIGVACKGTTSQNNANTAAAPSPVRSTEATTNKQAPEPNSILFIVDSSGSIKAKAGSRTKMDSAKEVVGSLIGTLPNGTNAGLMAYGHRQKNDCKDIELLIPVGPVQTDVFTQKVNSLQPIGETPISASIRQAADALKGVKGRKTVILISDGEETCHQDPCGVAAELKKADVDLQVHVVGFGIDNAAAKRQLTCIAEATGGVYKDAGNAEELKSVLEGIAKAAETKGDFGRLITSGQTVDGRPLNYYIDVYQAGTQQIVDAHADTWVSARANDIPPGVYDLKYWNVGSVVIWKRNVEIRTGEDTTVDLGQFGRVKASITDQKGVSVPMGADVFLASNPNDQVASFNTSTTLDLPPGIYNIKFWAVGVPSTSKTDVEIKPGQETAIEIQISK